MIDIHSHIIYGIDDGAKDIEESISIIKKMEKAGYSTIIATPHYIENSYYAADNKLKKERLEEIQKRLAEENINVKLYLGNEIFIQEDIIKKIIKGEIYTLNNSKYMLIELPLNERLNYALDILYELIATGAKVVLAHPERYAIFKRNPEEVKDFLDIGVLLQGNIDALSGKYGKEAKRLFEKYLRERKYFALASDVHTSKSNFYDRVPELKEEAIRLTDKGYIKELMEINPNKIINNL